MKRIDQNEAVNKCVDELKEACMKYITEKPLRLTVMTPNSYSVVGTIEELNFEYIRAQLLYGKVEFRLEEINEKDS